MEMFKPGDKVKCVNPWEAYGMQRGIEYTVVGVDTEKNQISVRELDGWFGFYRFVKTDS